MRRYRINASGNLCAITRFCHARRKLSHINTHNNRTRTFGRAYSVQRRTAFRPWLCCSFSHSRTCPVWVLPSVWQNKAAKTPTLVAVLCLPRGSWFAGWLRRGKHSTTCIELHGHCYRYFRRYPANSPSNRYGSITGRAGETCRSGQSRSSSQSCSYEFERSHIASRTVTGCCHGYRQCRVQ